jgi:hypothetical protein
MYSENFPRMFLPRLDGKLRKGNVEEFDRAIAASSKNLVLVRFGPRAVKERVLCVEPVYVVLACERMCAQLFVFGLCLPFLRNYAIGC